MTTDCIVENNSIPGVVAMLSKFYTSRCGAGMTAMLSKFYTIGVVAMLSKFYTSRCGASMTAMLSKFYTIGVDRDVRDKKYCIQRTGTMYCSKKCQPSVSCLSCIMVD